MNTYTVLTAEGGFTTMNEENQTVTFEFDGFEIENPTESECGRFSVSPAYYGFEVIDTGGGMTAWRKVRDDGLVLILTDNDNECGTTHEFADGDLILLGLYPPDDDGLAEHLALSTLTAGAA